MQKIYIEMIKEILSIIDSKSINIGFLSNKIGITNEEIEEYLTLEKQDFSMYLLILDTLRGYNYE